jgi:hypothetical protein
LNIILGIPGPWDDAVELGQAIVASNNDGYGLHDGQLIGPELAAPLELCEHDPGLRRSFELANRRSLSNTDLDRIEAHASCAYLICPGGSMDAGRHAMALAARVLRAGGYAVRVETAGVAHSASDWLAQTERNETHVGALYIGFVALINRQGQVYSCGMHNLGYPDATVSALPVPTAGELLRGFLMSVVHEQPLLISGKSTLNDGAGTLYLLTHEGCTLFEPDDPFFNPYGVWQLTPVQLSGS